MMVCLAGQQAIRPGLDGILQHAAACAAHHSQRVHRLAAVHRFYMCAQRIAANPCDLLHIGGAHTAHAAQAAKGSGIVDAEQRAQNVIHAARGRIQIGVHTNGRNVLFHHAEHHILPPQLFHGIKNDGVMRYDQLAALIFGLGHHFIRDVQRHQNACHIGAAIHQKAHIVPVLGQSFRRELLHILQHFLQFSHFRPPLKHGSDRPPNRPTGRAAFPCGIFGSSPAGACDIPPRPAGRA